MALTEQQIGATRRWAEAVARGISPYQQERIVALCEEITRLTALVATQQERIAWMLGEAGGTVWGNEYVEGLHAERDTLRATVAGLTTACEIALGCIVRSDWKGRDARTALIALGDALAAVPPATPAPDGRRDAEAQK